MSTDRKNVLITGASTGIGRATALRLDRNGFRVFAGVRRDEDAQSLRNDCTGPLTPLILDVTDGESIARAVEQVSEQVGDAGLHGLVNNAGVAVAGPLEALPLEEWRRQFDVSFFGVVAMIREFLPLLRLATGRIVNISSLSGRVGVAYFGPYVAAKHALEAMSDALRQELRKWGMRVSIVEPGLVVTPMVRDKAKKMNADLRASVTPDVEDRYGPVLDAFEKTHFRWQSRGIAPDKVAAKIQRALTAWRPKARYIVGWDARSGLFLKWLLPHLWMDWVLKKFLGLPQ